MTDTTYTFVPPALRILPSGPFEALIGSMGQRVAWMRSHTCPCTYSSAGPNGQLPFPGSAAKGCLQCFGVGTYWDPPSQPVRCWISYMHLSTAPDEPGADVDNKFGTMLRGDPTITIPYRNPYLAQDDPAQPTPLWTDASLSDMFVPVDMVSRFTAVLQNGGQIILPYQQNLTVPPSGAVTTYDPVSRTITQVSGYTVSGASVQIPESYPLGLDYMVEFQAAPLYVAFRHAGGVPHVRPFGGGTVNEPRRFRLQILDYWTRQTMQQNVAAGTAPVSGTIMPFGSMTGQPVLGVPAR